MAVIAAQALEVDIPAGWEATAISDEGYWDEVHCKVKWGPFFEDLSRTVSLQLVRVAEQPTGPKRINMISTLTGRVAFDGVVHSITVR